MQATKGLISVMKESGPRLDSLERNSLVWKDIRKSMLAMGYDYEIPKMQEVWSNLVSKFKTFKTLSKTSGEKRVDWELWDAMNDVMGESVSVDPLRTVAVGKTSQIKTRAPKASASSASAASASTSSASVPWQETVANTLVSLVKHLTKDS